MDRRYFLKTAGLAGGGLLLTVTTFCSRKTENERPVENAVLSQLNAFLKIDSAGNIVYAFSKHEMGQGTSTSMAMMLAEELCADWQKLKIEFIDADLPTFQNDELGGMSSGGSTTILTMWPILRHAGASARQLLVKAAAQTWNLPESDCFARNSQVLNKIDKRKLSYGELAEIASGLTPPEEISFTEPASHQLVGKPVAGKNIDLIATGNYHYAIDRHVDGMLYAVVARCPVYRGKLKSFDPAAALAVPGVRKVVTTSANAGTKGHFQYDLRDGVAVLADNTWAAIQGRRLLKIEWDWAASSEKDLAEFEQLAVEKMNQPSAPIDFRGTAHAIEKRAASEKLVEADYVYPYQLHMFMEPLNCIAHHRADEVELWLGHQSPNNVANAIAIQLGVTKEKVKMHLHPSGGGFGRRYYPDIALEATLISREAGNVPVKLLWTREDDFQHNHTHCYTLKRYQAAISASNELKSWYFKELRTYTWGAKEPYGKEISWIGYNIPNIRYDFDDMLEESLVQCCAWRSVLANGWAFGQECFFDEVAQAMGKDPYELRMSLLEEDRDVNIGHQHPLSTKRLRNVLALAAEKAGWGNRRPKGKGMGIAAYPYMHGNSYCAMVAEVAVAGEKVTVEKVVVAADCGKVINPSNARNQIEGGIMWGLSALLHGGVAIEKGRVVNANFHQQRFLRMEEAPRIETHFIESGEDPWGIGELSPPVVVPAVINAVFAATGKRVRRLPLSLEAALS